MKLSDALKNNSAAVQGTQASYQDDVYAVTNMMTTVFVSTLPNLNYPPANWSEIVTAYTTAKSDAHQWANTVYADLQATPQEVESYNSTITRHLQDAITNAQALVDGATGADATDALEAITRDLSSVSGSLNLIYGDTSDTLQVFDEFGYTTLPDAAKELQTVADDAYTDYNIDQDKINDLKAQIKTIQK